MPHNDLIGFGLLIGYFILAAFMFVLMIYPLLMLFEGSSLFKRIAVEHMEGPLLRDGSERLKLRFLANLKGVFS